MKRILITGEGSYVGEALRAHLAMEKLLELKEKKSIEPELRLPVSLVVRGSTAAVRK